MDLSQAPPAPTEELQLLILVGLPGSGKSCLATALEQTGKWLRASQDDAPNRKRQEAEAMTRRAIQSGRNAVVDRVGFDRKQRSHFIEIAKEYPNVRCNCLVLDVKRESLEARLAARTGHPTLIDIDIAMRVLAQMQREYKPPRPDQPEGYARVYIMPEHEQPKGGIWTEAHLDELLEKIAASAWRDEPYVPPPPKPVGYSRGGRARGTGQDGHPRGFEHERSDRGYPDSTRGRYQYHPRPVGQESFRGAFNHVPPWRRPAQPDTGFNPDALSGLPGMPNHVRFGGGASDGNAIGPGPGPFSNESPRPPHGFRGGRGGFDSQYHQRGRGRGGYSANPAHQYLPVNGRQVQDPAFGYASAGPVVQSEMAQPHDQPTQNT